jgi:hypothetical protein
MPEKGTEDIVGRLEALRKRVPTEAPPDREEVKPPSDGRRKKIARVVGIVIIVLVIIGIGYAGFKFVIKPKQIEEQERIDQAALQQAALQQAKKESIAAIEADFQGLPLEYALKLDSLIAKVDEAGTLSAVQSARIEGDAAAVQAWMNYKSDQLNKLAEKTDKIRMVVTVEQLVGNETKPVQTYYKGYERIQGVLSTLSLGALKSTSIEEIRTTYVAVRLKRLQAGGGLVEIGKKVNVYFREVSDVPETPEEMVALAKDAKVMAIMRAKSSSIALSETENRKDTGAGGSTSGTATVSLGGIGAIDTEGGASAGYRERQTMTSYSIDIKEVQKAAAASKLEESYIESVLMQYGIKLGNIERESNVADFEEEFILLLEVSEEEAPGILEKMTDVKDKSNTGRTVRENIYIALSEPTSWMTGI